MRGKIGILVILAGILLTLETTTNYHGITQNIFDFVKNNWPLLIVLYGISMVVTSKNKKTR